MAHEVSRTARDRLRELAEDPRYRPFIIGYLLEALDERFWPLLVQNALEHAETCDQLSEERAALSLELHLERYS